MGRCCGTSGRGIAAALLLVASGCVGTAAPTVRLDPVQATPPGGDPLGQALFMVGCWQSPPGTSATTIEERYAPPAGGLILGTTRFLRPGARTTFEFSTLAVEEGVLTLTPYPGGVRSPHAFRLTAAAPGRLVFEAPEHDYPKRIIYERIADDGLRARIDAGAEDPDPPVWEMVRVPCEAAFGPG